MPIWSRPHLLPVLAGILAACQQNLDTPVDCSVLCAGEFMTLDTTLMPSSDSSFEGYVLPGQGSSLLSSDGLAAGEFRTVLRFQPRPDSLDYLDTLRAYTVDSVDFAFFLQARDSTVIPLRLIFYRIPATTDSGVTFHDVQSAATPANLIDTLLLPSTLNSGEFHLMLSGSKLGGVAIPPSDSGVLALAIFVDAVLPTGVRLSSQNAELGGGIFTSYVSLTPAGVKRVLQEGVDFATFVRKNPPVLHPNLLTLGGAPSARSLLRFAIPPRILDSTSINRATLELTPTGPYQALPFDPTGIEVRRVLSDLGAKSVIAPQTSGAVTLTQGSAATVQIDLAQLMRGFQVDTTAPRTVFLIFQPEGSSFGRPTYYSTRSPTGQPKLRITYTIPFPFQRP